MIMQIYRRVLCFAICFVNSSIMQINVQLSIPKNHFQFEFKASIILLSHGLMAAIHSKSSSSSCRLHLVFM
jgi:hypothetical protein